MRSKGWLRIAGVLCGVLGAAVAPAVGCSLSNVVHDACTSDAQCALAFGTGSTCSNGYCTTPTSPGCEKAGPNGNCFTCTPSATPEFERACTNANCVPFDNKTRLTEPHARRRLAATPMKARRVSFSSVFAPASVAVLAAIGTASRADAAACSSLTSPVYIAGSGVATTAQLQMQLATQGYTIVYIKEESCLALREVVNDTPIETDGAMTGTILNGTCTLDATTVPDIALSDVFASTCA